MTNTNKKSTNPSIDPHRISYIPPESAVTTHSTVSSDQTVPDYIGWKTENMPNDLKDLAKDNMFKVIFKSRGYVLDETCVGFGASSAVFSCNTGSSSFETVFKVSSLRKLSGDNQTVSYSDVTGHNSDPDDEVKLENYFRRESIIYDHILSDEQKEYLVEPFIIKVYIKENVVDYLICVHMPLFTKVEDRLRDIQEAKLEAEILKIAADVLETLDKEGIISYRHRDIKLENVMYDNQNEKYVLIDWGFSLLNIPAYNRFLNTESYSIVYVDPERLEGNHQPCQRYELYSLGVLMAYLAHHDGFRNNNGIEKFAENHPEQDCGNKKVLSRGIHSDLEYFSSDFKDIIRKAMNHNFGDSASEMKVAVRDALNNLKTTLEEFPWLYDKLKFSLWHSFIIPFLVLLFPFAFSGSDGINSVICNQQYSNYGYLACFILFISPVVFSSYKISEDKEFKISRLSLIGIILLFTITSCTSAIILRLIDIPYPLLASCIHFAVAVFCFVLEDFTKKKFGFSFFLRIGAFSGALVGLVLSICIGPTLEWKNLGENLYNIGIPAVLSGIVLAALFHYSLWLFKTSLWFANRRN